MSRPSYILFAGLLVFGFGLILTPNFFIWLGPLKTSLLSEIESVRSIAQLEVFIARLLVLGTSVALIAAWVFWPKLSESRVVNQISNHQLATPLDLRLPNTSLIVMSSMFVLILVLVAIAGFFPGVYPTSIMEEDGLIEYATAFVFLICSVLSGYLVIKLPERRKKIIHFILCLGFFLCFGEEISWGQRILDFDTPDAVQAINVQGEFNIHNSFGYLADHVFIAGVFIYGGILPIIASCSPFSAKLVDLTGLPIASLGLAIGFVLASLLHNWTVYVVLPWTPIRIAEPREFLASIGFLLLMLETIRNAGSVYKSK